MIDYDKLKAEALASQKKRSRVILEPGFDMVICLHRDSYVRMHRHPRYEAYHILEGQLLIEVSDGLIIRTADDPIMTIPPMEWHQPYAQSEYVIYREFYAGPFEKTRDVEYASWKQKEAA